MADPTDPLGLANELRPVLLRLSRRIRREALEGGLTAGRVSLLAAIEAVPGVGVGDLAEQEAVSAPRISKAVGELVALGLVERHVPADRRRVGLTVTPKGVSVLRAVRRRRTAWLAERLHGMTADELDAIEQAIAPLSRLADADRES